MQIRILAWDWDNRLATKFQSKGNVVILSDNTEEAFESLWKFGRFSSYPPGKGIYDGKVMAEPSEYWTVVFENGYD